MKSHCAVFILALAASFPPPSELAYAKRPDNKPTANTIESLLRPARIRALSMSPNGKYAAGIAPMGGMDGPKGVVVIDLDTLEIVKSFEARAGRDIYRYEWLNNESIAFNISQWDSIVAGIYRADIGSKRFTPIIGNDAVARIIDANPGDPDFCWVWIRSGKDMKPCLAYVEKTGSAIERGANQTYETHQNPLLRERIPQPYGDVFGWVIDHDSEPRIVARFFEDKLEFIHRNNRDEEWKTLPLDPERWEIELFHQDNRKIYVSGYHGEDTKGLYLYDIDSNTFSDALFRDAYYDFSDTARYRTYNNTLLGIQYDRDVPTVVWLSEDVKAIQTMIDGALPGKANIIYEWNNDFTRHLLYSYSDTAPPSYYLLDLEAKSLKQITPTAPWLNHDDLAKTEVFHFTTSDGLRLEGYLTRPKSGQAPYPTVVLVHGGPWVRDSGTYDDEAQLLANFGYAVLKVNYRGSSGYGLKISEEPSFDFRRMHDDITEAVQMAVKAGIADSDRVAIMGASFGGYAAMCGAAFEPDLYQCAVTIMGVFDWEQVIRERKGQRHRYSHKRLVEALGSPKDREAAFEEISPIHHVDKIKIPVFIAHGKKDRNVSVRHSKDLKQALSKAGVEHETLFIGGEGHGAFELTKRVQLYERILAFLEANLK